MLLAVATNDPQSLYTLGVPGLVFVVVIQAGVIYTLYKGNQKVQAEKDAIQAQRVEDAKETRDKITQPLEKQASMSERIYDLLLNNNNARRR